MSKFEYILNANEQNRVLYTYDGDTTGQTVIYRLKKNIENTTAPLIEVTATKTLESATESTGYFDLDLTGTNYSGNHYFEIEFNDGVNPPIFWGESPTKVFIQIRLDN